MIDIFEKFKAIISDYEVLLWESEPNSYRFKAKLILIDGSQLIIRDYLFPSGRKYSFHWKDKNNNLLIRWDNSLHWITIETFPHHKHDKKNVLPSQDVTLEDVLNFICENIKPNGVRF